MKVKKIKERKKKKEFRGLDEKAKITSSRHSIYLSSMNQWDPKPGFTPSHCHDSVIKTQFEYRTIKIIPFVSTQEKKYSFCGLQNREIRAFSNFNFWPKEILTPHS